MNTKLPPVAPVITFSKSKIEIETTEHHNPASHLHPTDSDSNGDRKVALISRFLHWIPRKFLSVLDVGCADGKFVWSLVREGIYSVGLDQADFSSINGYGEWEAIPVCLVSANLNEPYRISLSCEDEGMPNEAKNALTFSIITASRLQIGLKPSDIQQYFSNIDLHLIPNGVVIAFIEQRAGDLLNQSEENFPRGIDAWISLLGKLGWKHHGEIVEYLALRNIEIQSDQDSRFILCLTRTAEEPLFKERVDINAYIFNQYGQPPRAVARLIPDMFNFRQDPVVVCDAGVRGGFEDIWKGFDDFLHFVGIDLDIEATDTASSKKKSIRKSVISRPIGAGHGRALLNRTRNEVASSFLPTNSDYIRRFPQMVPAEIISSEPLDFFEFKGELIKTGVNRVDYLKLDLEGFELEALKGLGSFKNTLLCVSVEIFFNPYKYGSPTYGMVEDYLTRC